MVKKLSKVLLCLMIALSGMSFVNAEEETTETPETITATGTQEAYVVGDDWGAAVSKTIITLDQTVKGESVSKDDFVVVETKAAVLDWSTYPNLVKETAVTERTIIDAYVSDANGNRATSWWGKPTAKYITIEMEVDPNIGSAFVYTGLNEWATPYYLDVRLAEGATLTTTEDKEIATITIDSEIAIDGEEKVCPQIEGVEFYGSRTDDDGDAFVYTAEDGTVVEVPYALYSPAEDGHTNGIFIWNHGAGEGGTDPQITVLANEVTALFGDEFQEIMDGCYVIAPQVPKGASRDSNRALAIKALVEQIAAENPDIDLDRVYVGGCSAGGGMTMTSLITTPEFYTAAVPICPASYPNERTWGEWVIPGWEGNFGRPLEEIVADLAEIPTWFVHALNDTTVGYEGTTSDIVALLEDAGAEVHTSLFEDVHDTTGRFTDEEGNAYQYSGHWSWIYFDNNECYDEDGVNCWEWLAQQTKAEEADATGTQTVTVIGEEWGAGVTKTTIKFDTTIDAKSIDAKDFSVNENKDGTVTVRTIVDAYASDEKGNEVTTDSEYVTIEMTISPSVGNPITWSMATWTNSWPKAYKLYVELVDGATLTAGETTIDSIDVEPLIDVADHETQNYPQLENVTIDEYSYTYTTKNEDGTTKTEEVVIPYGLYEPEEDGHTNGILIWNHGVGERGTDPKIAMYGNEVTGLWSDEIQEAMNGCYVLAAQVPPTGSTNVARAEAIVELVKELAAENPDIDLSRVYVSGCSMGGGMTTTIINNFPDFFTAAVPVCPAGIANAEAVNGLPVWYVHCENDGTVPVSNTYTSIDGLEALGSETHMSIFPDVTGTYTYEDGTKATYDEHWSWVYLFNNECEEDGVNLFEWLGNKANTLTIEAEGQLYAEVTDAGQVVNKLTIDFGKDYTLGEIDVDTFTVHASADTSEIREGTDVISYGDYSIDRTIEKVEVNGSVVTLYFNEAEGATLAYLASGRNFPAELTYTITLNDESAIEEIEFDYREVIIECGDIEANIIDEETAKFESVIVEDGINYQFYDAGDDAEALIVWFHGNGEGDYLDSDNNVSQMLANRGTVAWATEEAQDIFGDAHVMAFQAPDHWYNAKNNGLLEMAYEEIMAVVEEYGIDPEKILVSGCSAGGFMTTRMIIAYPDLFAAAMINCPALDVANARAGVEDATPTDEELASIKDSRTAIWLVQGATDSSVLPEDCSWRLFNILTEGEEITETRVEEEIQSSYTTYENESGKYLLTIYDTVDVAEDATGRAKGKLVFAEDYNHDGVLEEVKYSDHWSWIYTLRNNPSNADEAHIWEWAAAQANITSKTGDDAVIAPYIVVSGLALAGLVFIACKKRKEETNA